jgi:hypothetical protein
MNCMLLGALLFATACATGEDAPAPASVPPDHGGKLTAPITPTLTASARTGRVVARFELRADSDLPHAVARFVVLAGVKLVAGGTTFDLGRVAKGETRSVEVTLQVPSTGSYQLAAGADVFMTPTLKLHRGAVTQLGSAPPVKRGSEVKQLPEGNTARVGEAQRAR